MNHYQSSLSRHVEHNLKNFADNRCTQRERELVTSARKVYLQVRMIEASIVAQMVKNLLVMQETQVRSPGREDPLKKEMGSHSSILAWRVPWTEEPAGLQSVGRKGLDTAE